jgi:DNA repair protein RadD
VDEITRSVLIAVLRSISRTRWRHLLSRTVEGGQLAERIARIRETLESAALRGSPGSAAEFLVDLYGPRLLSDPEFGPWVRESILRQLPRRPWKRLFQIYRESRRSAKHPLHGNSEQDGAGSAVMAAYWRQGGRWAEAFCREAGLPPSLALSSRERFPDDEDVVPTEALPPLHDFQLEVYAELRNLLRKGRGKAALLSLPTGAGKTRVAVEAICDHFATATPLQLATRNIVVWVALSSELQLQAWECFRQVWQVPPQRPQGAAPVSRRLPLRIIRLWGGRDPDEIEMGGEPTVLVCGIDQLASWAARRPDWYQRFPKERLAGLVVDEAHSLITREYARVLIAFGLRKAHRWRTVPGSAPLIGLSATPWRTSDEETRSLLRFFRRRLVRPHRLGSRPIRALQSRGILSAVQSLRVPFRGAGELWESDPKYQQQYDDFKEYPADFLSELGNNSARNGRILRRLVSLPTRARAIVFACSVDHAHLLAAALNRHAGQTNAAVVTAKTPRAERLSIIQRFRDGEIRYIVNVGVLALGFDAPKTNVVFVTRPIASATRYEQMVGRGLRGPRNGGTKSCLVIDMQDEGLPGDIQSYARVLDLWDVGGRRHAGS